jgi:hypothetical protein
MMVKKIAIAGLCMALGSSLYAKDMSESKVFIGVEIESSKLDTSTKIDLNNVYLGKFDETGDSLTEYGLRIGAQNDEWRTTILYTYSDNKNSGTKEKMNRGSLLLDYFLWSTGSMDYDLQPYLGVHVGYMNYKVNTDFGLGINRRIFDASGIFYGGQLGVNLIVSDIVGFDLSYKYSATSISDTEAFLNGANNLLYKGKVDSIGSVAFSVNYFF